MIEKYEFSIDDYFNNTLDKNIIKIDGYIINNEITYISHVPIVHKLLLFSFIFNSHK